MAFTLTAAGTRKIEAVTAANVGKELAILLDDQIVSAPRIESAIRQADGRITGRFTRAEAADLAFAMRAGPLPVPLHVVEQRFLPAAPGHSSIHGVAVASAVVFSVGTLALLVVAFLRSSSGPRAGAPA